MLKYIKNICFANKKMKKLCTGVVKLQLKYFSKHAYTVLCDLSTADSSTLRIRSILAILKNIVKF